MGGGAFNAQTEKSILGSWILRNIYLSSNIKKLSCFSQNTNNRINIFQNSKLQSFWYEISTEWSRFCWWVFFYINIWYIENIRSIISKRWIRLKSFLSRIAKMHIRCDCNNCCIWYVHCPYATFEYEPNSGQSKWFWCFWVLDFGPGGFACATRGSICNA